jgi:hypothetical protein
MNPRVLLVAVLSFLLLPGPAAGADETPQGPALVTPEEVAAVEARVMARVDAYRVASCRRPVLRGTPAEGSGTEAVRGIAEGGPLHQRCHAFLDANAEGLPSTDFDAFIASGAGVAPDLAAALPEGCGELPAAIRDAVGHEDVCSPWRPGVRGNPSFLPILRTSKAAVILGRLGYTPADCLPELRVALDRIRYDQDIVRGGGTLIAAMVSVASTVRYQVPWIRWLLDRGDLDAAQLTEVIDSLGILLETEPSIGGIIEADGTWSFLQMILPTVKGSGWVPPGGWDRDHQPSAAGAPESPYGSQHFIDPATDAALVVVAMEEIQRTQDAACPADALPLACIDGLRRYGEEARRRDGNGAVLRAIKVLAAPDPRAAVRRWVVDILMGVGSPAFARYAEKYALRSFQLATLRLQAAMLREWRRTGGCGVPRGPGAGPLVADPIFRGPLEVRQEAGSDQWVVRPGGAFVEVSVNDEAVVRFSCPPRGAD